MHLFQIEAISKRELKLFYEKSNVCFENYS